MKKWPDIKEYTATHHYKTIFISQLQKQLLNKHKEEPPMARKAAAFPVGWALPWQSILTFQLHRNQQYMVSIPQAWIQTYHQCIPMTYGNYPTAVFCLSWRRLGLDIAKDVSTQVTINYSRDPEVGEPLLLVTSYAQQMTDVHYSWNIYISRPIRISNHLFIQINPFWDHSFIEIIT